MNTSPNAVWLSGIAAPLSEKFGSQLTVRRSGNHVCWAYDGQSAVIEFVADGLLDATFIDAPRLDAVSSAPAAAAYRTGRTYAIDAQGCRRMIADLVDFFSGVREPRFAFVDAFAR